MSGANLTGMGRAAGGVLSGDAHLIQSIGDIVSTPLATRLMRPDYGWLGMEILDRPLNRATALLLTSAAATALARWEPRVTVKKVAISGDFASGKAVMTITSQKKDGTTVTSQAIPLSR